MAQRDRLIANAKAEGRPTSYREDEQLDDLRARINRLDAEIGGKQRASDPPARIRQPRSTRIRVDAGRRTGRRTAGLGLYEARARALELKGRPR